MFYIFGSIIYWTLYIVFILFGLVQIAQSTFKVFRRQHQELIWLLQIFRRGFLYLEFQHLHLPYLFGMQNLINFFLFFFNFACIIFATMVFCWCFILKFQSGRKNCLHIFWIKNSKLVMDLGLVWIHFV